MNNKLYSVLLCAATFLSVALNPVFAQNGARIAATSGTADPSAMLDVVATDKGLLVPRMTLAQKNAIVNPANGLLVYQTDNSVGFYYNSGTPSVPNWVQLSAGALSGTGTTNTVTKWTSAGAIGNSQMVDDGTNVGIGIASPVQKFQVVGGNVQINNLAGAGMRAVYADASGVLKTVTATPVFYNYTGADQSYTVPAGVTSLLIKLWGAGGGGGYYGGWHSGFPGGGGGFTMGTLAVTPGQVITVMVGSGGKAGNQSSGVPVNYGGGGKTCISDCQYGACGGGRSAIRIGGVDILTAGGGGGGGSNVNIGWYSTNRGGAGGGVTGQNGECTAVATAAGSGGTQSAGGAQGTGGNSGASAGTQYTGGSPTTGSYGGGGGGGWFGGGGGAYTNGNTMGGGGGGSGYVGGAGVSNAFTMSGNFQYPAMIGDPHYQGGIGLGGAVPYSNAAPLNGGNGLVVIIPN